MCSSKQLTSKGVILVPCSAGRVPSADLAVGIKKLLPPGNITISLPDVCCITFSAAKSECIKLFNVILIKYLVLLPDDMVCKSNFVLSQQCR